jgi:hypothetical protein
VGGVKPRLPKRLYRLVVHAGEGESLFLYEQGSKTYSQLPSLELAAKHHRKKGRTVRVFQAELDWEEITPDEW